MIAPHIAETIITIAVVFIAFACIQHARRQKARREYRRRVQKALDRSLDEGVCYTCGAKTFGGICSLCR